MKVCGIVTEYNPMHMGHAYQINAAKEKTGCEATVLVMSGNFVQRGEPALIDKFRRAKAAVLAGVDLVIELPVYFATASAEPFSEHAIKILTAMGIVTHLNFGSELGDLDPLFELASLYAKEPLGYKHLLNGALEEGLSYPVARMKATLSYNDYHHLLPQKTAEIIKTPNNILGIEYMKAILRQSSPILPTTVKRVGAMYHDEDAGVAIPSATSIRKHLRHGGSLMDLQGKMPPSSFSELEEAISSLEGPIYREDLFNSIKYMLLREDSSVLNGIMDMSEGLEHRMIQAARSAMTYEDLLNRLGTKRYTNTKLARALLHIYLGMSENTFKDLKTMSPYIRVLAFNHTGQSLLKRMKDLETTAPVIINVKDHSKRLDRLQRLSFEADIRATLLYNHLIFEKSGVSLPNDYERQVIRL